MKDNLQKNNNTIRNLKYIDYNLYDKDIIICNKIINNDEYDLSLDSTIHYFECEKCSRLCSYIYNNPSCETINKIILNDVYKKELLNEFENIINTNEYLNEIELFKKIKYSLSNNYLTSYYYNKYLNIEKGCYICRCEICKYPLIIYENIYNFEEYNRIFIKCIICEKFKKYIKESFIQISILRNLNTKYNDIFKNIKYNNSYYNIVDLNNTFLIGIKKNIFQNFIKELKKDNELYIIKNK